MRAPPSAVLVFPALSPRRAKLIRSAASLMVLNMPLRICSCKTSIALTGAANVPNPGAAALDAVQRSPSSLRLRITRPVAILASVSVSWGKPNASKRAFTSSTCCLAYAALNSSPAVSSRSLRPRRSVPRGLPRFLSSKNWMYSCNVRLCWSASFSAAIVFFSASGSKPSPGRRSLMLALLPASASSLANASRNCATSSVPVWALATAMRVSKSRRLAVSNPKPA